MKHVPAKEIEKAVDVVLHRCGVLQRRLRHVTAQRDYALRSVERATKQRDVAMQGLERIGRGAPSMASCIAEMTMERVRRT